MASKSHEGLAGKVIYLTGGTAGLGKTTVLALAAKKPKTIIFTGRNATRAQALIDEVKASLPSVEVKWVACDLGSFASIKKTSQDVKDSGVDHIDILVCNAGIMCLPPGLTSDGYEIQFGTNFLGHALLIKELLPLLQRAHETRVVMLSSLGFQLGSGIDFQTIRTGQSGWVAAKWLRYGRSKLAQILYTQELAKRYPDITFVSIHPGVINTGLVTDLPFMNRWFVHATTIGQVVTPEEGVQNTIWASTAPKADINNGGFYEPVGQVGRTTAASRNTALAKELYDWTQQQF